MAILTFVGYCRSRTGAAISTATVSLYTLTDVNSNTKGGSTIATTSPSSSSGRWTLSVDTVANPSPTGYYAIKITNGTDIRWLEPDTSFMLQTMMGANGALPLAAGSATDTLIGNRTLNPATVPAGNTGDLTTLLSGLANRIKAASGATNWYDTPALTLATLSAHASRHATAGADPIAPADIGASAIGHTHDFGGNYAPLVHTHAGGDITSAVASATNATSLGGTAASSFPIVTGANVDGANIALPLKVQVGSAIATFTSGISAGIAFPSSFTTLRVLIVTRGSNEGGGYVMVPHTSNASSFTVATDGASYTGTLRVNYVAFGT